ncbi:MAG: hypothetical protein ACREML_02495 [Vulcanimicrobiaceae bacterium]
MRRNPIFRHASPGAKLLFYASIEIAGDLEQDGALATRIGPLTLAQIADEVNLTAAQTKKALDELIRVDLVHLRLDGAFVVSGFSDKTAGKGSTQLARADDNSAERMRRHRDRNRDGSVTSHDTSQVTNSDAIEVEGDTPSLRSGARQASSQKSTTWVEPLRLAVKSSVDAGKRLCDLSADETFDLARYHAWRWANCTKSERSNRSKARSIASGISNIAKDRRYGELTVRDYIAHADQVWKSGSEAPWFRPWDVTARIELETAS